MNQHKTSINLDPTFLGYTEKQLVQSSRGNYNVRQLVKNYENLLAFNYALCERTKVAGKPIAGASEEALGIVKRKFDSSMPTLHEHKRVLEGKDGVDRKTSMVAAFSATETPIKPPEMPPERADPNSIMTWNCNGIGPHLKNTEDLRKLN